MSTYQQLLWRGPTALKDIDIRDFPQSEGIYVLTNSTSPFAFKVSSGHICPEEGIYAQPQILYAGCARNLAYRLISMLKGRCSSRLSMQLQKQQDIFLYWAQAENSDELEKSVLQDYSPVMNRMPFPLLMRSTETVRDTTSLTATVDPIAELENKLSSKCSDERWYQSYFQTNPWILNLHFTAIEGHRAFDDNNIPDFTAIRSRDGNRDIIEIKQPFLPIADKKYSLTGVFDKAWNQCERYLDFARQNREYLRQEKGLDIDNPHCYLLIGFAPHEVTRKEIRRKERMNPAITVITYNELVRMARGVLCKLEQLRCILESGPEGGVE